MRYLQTNQIHEGNAEELMKNIEPESISLSFWSPPYFVGKEYEKNSTYESWQKLLRDVIFLHFKVLKKGSFLVINIADILAFKDHQMPRIQALNISNQKCPVTRDMVIEAKKLHPDYNRYQLAELLGCSEQTIDRRLNGNNIRGGKYSVQTKVKLVGGSLEKYAEEAGLYLYDHRIWKKDPAWQNSKWTTNTYKAVSEYEDLYVFWKPGEYTVNRNKMTNKEWKDWGYRGIWEIPSVKKNDDHEAKFPVELASRVIKLYSELGDTVLDPFMGSGTTALAAIKNKRNYIGIEKEHKYVKLSQNNIYNLLESMNQIDIFQSKIFKI